MVLCPQMESLVQARAYEFRAITTSLVCSKNVVFKGIIQAGS